jgi:hypothetical protein
MLHKLLEILLQNELSEDNFDLNSNIMEILQEVFENSTTDLIQPSSILKILSSLLTLVSKPGTSSLFKLPNLIIKLMNFSKKAKVVIDFGAIASELQLVIQSIKLHLDTSLKTGIESNKTSYFYSVSRKTLQVLEILEALVATEDPLVFEQLRSQKALSSLMVV